MFSIVFTIVIFAIAINSALSWIVLALGGIALPIWYENIKNIQMSDKKDDED
jgi:hypothetical protein